MRPRARPAPTEIAFYEGLIRTTASRCAPRVEEDFDDIVSIFRVKVWQALEAFDRSRSKLSVERYVFSCVKNQEKDLLKRRRRGEVFFADVLGDAPSGEEHVDRFERRYLAVDADVVYEDVERELPLIPSTLTELEREVVVRLYLDFKRREIAAQLGLSRPEMERVARSIKTKMEDWRPGPTPAVSPTVAAATGG